MYTLCTTFKFFNYLLICLKMDNNYPHIFDKKTQWNLRVFVCSSTSHKKDVTG